MPNLKAVAIGPLHGLRNGNEVVCRLEGPRRRDNMPIFVPRVSAIGRHVNRLPNSLTGAEAIHRVSHQNADAQK